MRQEQFRILAIGKQRAMQFDQLLDQTCQPLAAPFAQLYAQFALVFPEHAAGRHFAFQQRLDIAAGSKLAGKLCQLRRAALESEENADGIESQFPDAVQFRSDLARFTRENHADQGGKAVILGPRADCFQSLDVCVSGAFRTGIEIECQLDRKSVV